MTPLASIVCELVDDAAYSLTVQLEEALASTTDVPWSNSLRDSIRIALADGLATTTSVIIMALKQSMS